MWTRTPDPSDLSPGGASVATVTYRVRRVRAEDWERIRAIRLEMLRDTPSAYLETLSDSLRYEPVQWQRRAERDAAGDTSASFTAETPDGTWVGRLSVFVDEPGRVHVVAVYVAPAHRGTERGVLRLLVNAGLGWARQDAGATRAHLYVHERNDRARAAYERLGFLLTGQTLPYDPVPGELELELAREL